MKNWFKHVGGEDKNISEKPNASDEKMIKETTSSEGNTEEEPVVVSEAAQEEISPSATGEGDNSAKSKKPREKRAWSLKKKIIVTIASVFGVAILCLGAFIASLYIVPMGGFKTIGEQAQHSSAPTTSVAVDNTGGPTSTPTLDEYGQLVSKSDFSILDQTVNILLIGVDYAPERDDWSGKHYFHSDVMIILAINKQTGSVNLISLPRDTYIDMPGVKGIYKINASMDCGGGWKDNPEQGCKKVCESASWMIGNIPIDYYYAVDMSAVKGLVDAIDGVDFNIDVPFSMQGRDYSTGMQHMNGQAVLDYLRARKEMGDDSGDLNRINRQKNMLVAILKKLKDTGLILKIPDILGAFSGNLKTNVDFSCTCALAAYASTIDISKIKLYSMDGSYCYHLFNWNFVITDQNKRAQIIKEVYGFDITNDADVQALEAKYGIQVPSYANFSMRHALGLWEKMEIQVTSRKADPLLEKVKAKLDADALLPPYPALEPPAPAVSTDPSVPTPEPTPEPTPVPSDGYRRYPAGGDVWALYNKVQNEYSQVKGWSTSGASKSSDKQFQDLLTQFHTDIQSLCEKFGISQDWKHCWEVDYGDHAGRSSSNQSYVRNEIPVDFN